MKPVETRRGHGSRPGEIVAYLYLKQCKWNNKNKRAKK